MTCGRQTGLWLDEHRLVIASCWLPPGHRWECHDRLHSLRWTPGGGVDSTGTRYLIDLADIPVEEAATLGADAVNCHGP